VSAIHEDGDDRAVPVIFDTDMDFDDSTALAYLVAEHKLGRIKLLAVTVTNNGVGLPGRAIFHARCLLDRFGLSEIPVADNAAVGPRQFPAQIQLGAEFILNGLLDGCTKSDQPSAISAPRVIVDIISHQARPVTIVTSGPVTNLADALRFAKVADRSGRRPFMDNVDSVFTMGGAVHVPGNVPPSATEDGTQEFNIWGDPAAAQAVFDGYSRLKLVPLDATQFVPVTVAFSNRVIADHDTTEADYVAALLSNPLIMGAVQANLGFFWWDPLDAIASQTDGVVTYESDRILVVQSGLSAGRTIAAGPRSDAPRLRVGIHASTTDFENVFLNTLNGHVQHH
jgi:inosine-uridine nucleoside N-ribohydrolase